MTNKMVHLDATQEEEKTIAQANAEIDPKTKRLRGPRRSFAGSADGEVVAVSPKQVDLNESPRPEIWSVATALIPFLEHDDANRALMRLEHAAPGVPLLKPEAPLVGTGWGTSAAIDTATVVLASAHGEVHYVDAEQHRRHPRLRSGTSTSLLKHMRSNQGTIIHQRPMCCRRQGEGRGRARRTAPPRPAANRPRQERSGRLHVLGGLQLRGRDHHLLAPVADDELTSIPASRSTRSTPARRSSATRRSPASIQNRSRRTCGTSTRGRSSGSVPRSSPATCWSGRSRRRARVKPRRTSLRDPFKEKAREVRDTCLKVPHGEGAW